MKYILSLLLICSLWLPSFVVAEEVLKVEDKLPVMDYDGGNSKWIVLDDSSYRISNTTKYFDKAGLPVKSLSLNDNDKVLVEIEYPEDPKLPGEVISLQLYKVGAIPVKNVSENGVGQLPKKEDKPLYKEDGVWKN